MTTKALIILIILSASLNTPLSQFKKYLGVYTCRFDDYERSNSAKEKFDFTFSRCQTPSEYSSKKLTEYELYHKRYIVEDLPNLTEIERKYIGEYQRKMLNGKFMVTTENEEVYMNNNKVGGLRRCLVIKRVSGKAVKYQFSSCRRNFENPVKYIYPRFLKGKKKILQKDVLICENSIEGCKHFKNNSFRELKLGNPELNETTIKKAAMTNCLGNVNKKSGIGAHDQFPILEKAFLEDMEKNREKLLSCSVYEKQQAVNSERKKILHSAGIMAPAKLNITNKSFSGNFETGFEYGVLRFSLGVKPEGVKFNPSFSFKGFRDNMESGDILAMQNFEGQNSNNFFENPLSNTIPEPNLDNLKSRIHLKSKINKEFEGEYIRV